MMTSGVATAMSEEDRLIATIDVQISSRERARAMLEPPWDGGAAGLLLPTLFLDPPWTRATNLYEVAG
jgi:hypothetical protein